jgi:hypothetical protein
MTPITLQAHFDGQHILLNEPFDLQPGTQLIVTVLKIGGAACRVRSLVRPICPKSGSSLQQR